MSSQQHWRKQLLKGGQVIDAKLLADVQAIVGETQVKSEEPMSKHTTYRIGGPAELFVVVEDRGQLSQVLQVLSEKNVMTAFLGGGSNMLVQDGGLRGAVIQLGKGFEQLDIDEGDSMDSVNIGAAASIGRLMKAAKERGWSKISAIAGTPGSMGGALKMNAGSRTVGIGDFVVSVDVMQKDGRERTISKEKIHYGYRQSKFPPGSIIIGGQLQFEKGKIETVRSEIEQHIERRKETQPLNLPNGGSVFRNPEGMHAAELIERSGLKGVRLQHAQISEKHANFIVNLGGAEARDVVALIKMIKQKVYEETNVKLEEELRIIGSTGGENE